MDKTPASCVSIVPLFAPLSRAAQDSVAEFARSVKVEAGKPLQLPGERSGRLFVVHKGVLTVSRVSPDGQKQVLRILKPGDFTGEIDFVTGLSSQHLLVADTDVAVCQFSHEDLASLIGQYPEIGVEMLQAVTARLDDAERALTASTSTSAIGRLAKYLLDLSSGETQTPGTKLPRVVYLPTTKRSVASLLGVSPETLSRRLRDLVNQGIVEVEGSKVSLLDQESLVALANQ